MTKKPKRRKVARLSQGKNQARLSECGKLVYILLRGGVETVIDRDRWDDVRAVRWHKHATSYVGSAPRGKPGILLHRLLTAAPQGRVVDHINRNGLDNRTANLRLCSTGENLRNATHRQNGTSKYRGVSWKARDRKWWAHIRVNNKKIHLGYTDDESAAALLYNVAAAFYHGEFASLNDVPGAGKFLSDLRAAQYLEQEERRE